MNHKTFVTTPQAKLEKIFFSIELAEVMGGSKTSRKEFLQLLDADGLELTGQVKEAVAKYFPEYL